MPKCIIPDHSGTATDTQFSITEQVLHWVEVHVYRGRRIILRKAATALLPPALFLHSAGHSCGEEDDTPGKHLWSCTTWSLHPPGHDDWHCHPAPSSLPFFTCLHWCESETQPTWSLRHCASMNMVWQESTPHRRGRGCASALQAAATLLAAALPGGASSRSPMQLGKARPRFRYWCQRAPTVASAVHFHNPCFFVWETFSSKHYTARFYKLELWD